MAPPGSERLTELAKRDVAEAIELLDCLATRQLTAANWDHVAVVISALGDAVNSSDPVAFGTLVGDLEILSLEPASRTERPAAPIPTPVVATASRLSRDLRSVGQK
jgi:hypothetical protein